MADDNADHSPRPPPVPDPSVASDSTRRKCSGVIFHPLIEVDSPFPTLGVHPSHTVNRQSFPSSWGRFLNSIPIRHWESKLLDSILTAQFTVFTLGVRCGAPLLQDWRTRMFLGDQPHGGDQCCFSLGKSSEGLNRAVPHLEFWWPLVSVFVRPMVRD